MNRNETNRFAVNPTTLDISRSIFNRDKKVLTSGNCGDVIPIYLSEVLPGDTFNVTTSKVVRLQPLVTPVMDNLYADFYYFFCPTLSNDSIQDELDKRNNKNRHKDYP